MQISGRRDKAMNLRSRGGAGGLFPLPAPKSLALHHTLAHRILPRPNPPNGFPHHQRVCSNAPPITYLRQKTSRYRHLYYQKIHHQIRNQEKTRTNPLHQTPGLLSIRCATHLHQNPKSPNRQNLKTSKPYNSKTPKPNAINPNTLLFQHFTNFSPN